ncbi:MAG: ABC transporter substrate-binding protein [Flavobacterium sp.]
MMRYIFLLFLFSLSNTFCFSQNKELWTGYFSYNEIKDISQSANKIYAASENAVFSKNISTNEIKTINTIDGLSSQVISAIYHSAKFNKTLVGYQNGLINIVNETDGKVLNVVDIVNKQLPPTIKKINHFMEYGDLIYISTDFGIVQFNLKTSQFGDTFFIGNTKSEIAVSQTTIFKDHIYAATFDEGLKRALISNPNLIDASVWDKVKDGSFSGVTTIGVNLCVVSSSGDVFKSVDGLTFSTFGPHFNPAPIDLRSNGTHLSITSTTWVFVFDVQLNEVVQLSQSQVSNPSPTFSCATLIDTTLYIGTTEAGIVTTPIGNSTDLGGIMPSGPSKNNIFSITVSNDNLWATYGDYDQYYNPHPLNYYGISKFNTDEGWLNIPFSEMDGASDLVRLTVNPKKENQIFVSSYHNGLLKFENEKLTTHYDHTNSELESVVLQSDLNYKSVRIEQTAFDKSGNLWVSNGLVKNGLKVLKPDGQWISYNMETILDDYNRSRIGRMVIDKNGTKWLSTVSDGLIAFNETKGNIFKKITEGSDKGNLPSASVQVAAIDNRNQVWIGTRKGLRVLSSVDRFLSNEPMRANSIIIMDDGIAQELMYQQFITDIVVDGANNKWVGTSDAGVFLFSPSGQQTIYHFTTANSPLPSDNINDIDINPVTGEVFFATINGMVSFKGSATKANTNLDNVVVYPNPVRPEFEGNVKITGLLDKANVKITDIEGNLVHEAVSEGGSVEWNTTAFGKYRVKTGVYMIFIAGQDGTETQVRKVMIIR